MKYEIDVRTSQAVMETATLEITGNIVPPQWMDHLRTPSNKPNLVAAVVLSEVIYWNKPVYDREKGKWLKKFVADKWQMNYSQVADHWGFSKVQVRRAVYYLRDQELINVEYRTVTLPNGDKITNVPFVEPVIQNIRAITMRIKPDQNCTGLDENAEPDQNCTGSTSKSLIKIDQYTEITNTEITEDKKIPEPEAQAASEAPKKAIEEEKKPEGGNGNGKPETSHQELMRLYQEALGYKIPNGGQEGAAAKKILRYYSPQDAIGCYRFMKSDPWWAQKHLSLQSVHKQIGPWIKAGRPTHKNGYGGMAQKMADFSGQDMKEVNKDAIKKMQKLVKDQGWDRDHLINVVGLSPDEATMYLGGS